MSSSKKQSLIIIAIALIIIGVILAVFALSQPKVYVDSSRTLVSASQQDDVTEEKQTATEMNVNLPLNINTCTYEELLAIEDIGEARASAIIEYRDALGSYTAVEQIKNIEGIGESLYEKISPYLFV